MPEATIALIAAMPEEIKPLLRRSGPVRRERLGGFPCYRFSSAGHPCCLVESGMGPRHAVTATRALLTAITPRALLNFGFAGAVTAGPTVGDIVVAERLLCLHERLFTEESGLSRALTEGLVASLAAAGGLGSARLFAGTFITSSKIVAKQELAGRLPADAPYPVLEMETAAIARVAAKAEVPLVALRAVSDAADEELGFAITDFTDADLNLRLHRILFTVARRPRIIPQLLRLARNSRHAGETLATAVETAIAGL
jgi:adenosylhomocysteine nucleosidase